MINHELVLRDNDFAELLIVLHEGHYNRWREYGAFALVVAQTVLRLIVLATQAQE